MTSNVKDKNSTDMRTLGMAGLVGFLLFVLSGAIFSNLSFRLTTQLTYWEFHPMTFRMMAVFIVIIAISSFIIGYYIKKTHPTTNSMIVWGLGVILFYILTTLYLIGLTDTNINDYASLVFMPNFYTIVTAFIAGICGAKVAEKVLVEHLNNNGINSNVSHTDNINAVNNINNSEIQNNVNENNIN